MPRFRLLLPVLLLLAACGRDGDAPAPDAAGRADDPQAAAGDAAAPPSADEDFERRWLGVLPCADCDGIQTTLTLRRAAGEASFLLEEAYLGGGEPPRFETRGAWREEAGGIVHLDPDGISLRLRAAEDGGLELLDAGGRPLSDGPEYHLGRL